MQRVDDRTIEQITTHPVIIGGRDKFMSGWGAASGGSSYAGWACRAEDVDAVYAWVKGRGDITRVSCHYHGWYPRGRGHTHIYVVTDNHPALQRTPAAV